MGRASRKSEASAEPRSHWTETHPDRPLWSPGRLAQARTQTQEEYEALYGRGDPVEARTKSQEEAPRDSLLVPNANAALIGEMHERRWDKGEIIRFLEKAANSQGIHFDRLQPGDAFVEVLWRREWEETVIALEEMGAPSFLRVLEENQERARAIWEERFLRNLEDQIKDSGNIDPALSLYGTLLDGSLAWDLGIDQTEYRRMQAELICSMNEWAEKEFGRFSEFAEENLLPALRECQPSWAEYVEDGARDDVVRLVRHTVDATLDGADRFSGTLAHLVQSGYFEGTSDPADWSGTMLWRLAYDHSVHQYREEDWSLDEQKWEQFELRNTADQFGYIASSGANNFFASSLGQQIAAELRLQSPGDLQQIARHFSEDIAKDFLRGRIGLMGAWRKARDLYEAQK